MSALAKILRRDPSVVKGKHLRLRFMSGHFPEASMLKKAQLPAAKGSLWNTNPQCQDPCMVKNKGILLFLWIIPASGFSNWGLCMFRDRVFLWPMA